MAVVGVDLGATTITVQPLLLQEMILVAQASLIELKGAVVKTISSKIVDWSFESVCDQIAETIKSTQKGSTLRITCIGIGAPGNLDYDAVRQLHDYQVGIS